MSAEKNEYCEETAKLMWALLGRGMRGALMYTGASKLRQRTDDASDIHIAFNVNGKRGEGWHMKISYDQGADLFDAILLKKGGEAIEESKGLYAEDLKAAVERMYDDAIKARCGGFIPLD